MCLDKKNYMSFKHNTKDLNQQNLSRNDISFDDDEKKKKKGKFLNRIPFITTAIAVFFIIIDLGFLHNNTLRIFTTM